MIALPANDLNKNEPVGQLPPRDWMAWPETLAVVAALAAKGTEVRFVGGCVRDSLIDRPVRDIDIATPDRPEQVLALLAAAGVRAIPTGIAHGTVTAVVGERKYEITTLRRDVETDGRHARVAFTDDWGADAARRDFTINALYCRPDGAIYDPFEGIPDLAAGRVRFIGDASARIDEDVLRLLRYFRFYAWYGRPPADVDALAACRANASRLATLSGERLYAEFMKILASPDPAGACVMMQGEHVLAALLPEAQWIGRLRALSFLESRGLARATVRPDPLRRLAALIEADGAQIAAIAERFKLSRAEAERLSDLVATVDRPAAGMDAAAARRLLHGLGADRFRDRVLLHWAAVRDRGEHGHARDTRLWTDLLDQADAWVPQPLPVDGKDVVARGIQPGPRVGEILILLETWWQDSDFRANRADGLAKLDEILKV